MLDAASLEAIAKEARNCFLYEDAPEYLKMLNEGIKKLEKNLKGVENSENLTVIYKDLGRAAHSIKGGAGMAEMQLVSQLAHKIEDIFEALEQNRIKDVQTSLQLITLGIQELDSLIDHEINQEKDLEDENLVLELITALDEFLSTVEAADNSTEIGFATVDFIKTSLTVDLDHCIERVEEIFNLDSDQKIKHLIESLRILTEECTLLGQALNCFWLVEFATKLTSIKESNQIDIFELTPLAIAELKQLRDQFIDDKKEGKPEFSQEFITLIPKDKKAPINKVTKTENKLFEEQEISSSNLRIPTEKVINISDTIGEILIQHERLILHDNQLKQVSLTLKKRTKYLLPLKEQVESIYDHLTIINSNKKENNNHHSNGKINNYKEAQKIELLEEFDSLEFDEYTEIHSTLQQLTELIIKVEEVREDVDLLHREFQETLITMRQYLNNLDQNITQIRLVPFINLAGSFFNPIEKLNKKHHKSVELIIKGKQVLIDQTIIEKLRTPFNHIIRNAFDHGIESKKQRKKVGKSEQSKIILEAKLTGNNAIITITDDGQGIDIDKVFKKGVSLGLFAENISREEITEKEILDLIFSPGFSTNKKITDLSGRGMGMDIVKAEIEKLRGTIKVQTKKGKGTQFLLNIPLSLNIIPLLLIRCQQQKLAIPSDNILRIIRLSDYEINNHKILWEKQLIPFYYLYQLLPYNSNEILNYMPKNSHANIGLLLKIGTEKIFLTIDEILDEKELVTKSFDDTVKVPTYISGCTILGSGEIIPILVPDYLKQLLTGLNPEKIPINSLKIPTNLTTKKTILVIDDSMAVRRSLNRILTQSGYEVLECCDGKQAWDLLKATNQTFDLAICDLEMPNYDGYKVLELVRSSETWHNLPVLILTSRESNLHREKAMTLGANAYITKPFQPLKMLEKVEHYLEVYSERLRS